MHQALPETDAPFPGNTGLGKESCLQLAKHKPAHVWLAARTASKAEAAIADVKKAVPEAAVTHLPLDLSSLASVAQAAETFNSQSDRLDVLLNNAGVMGLPAGMTREGFEIQLGTNHVGHALLTKRLLPTLLKTADRPGADVRIVNLSSSGHQIVPSSGINFADTHLETSSTWTRYGQSKLANILFTTELARRYPRITSVAVHPGVVGTDLANTYKGSQNAILRALAVPVVNLVTKDIPTGTKNQLWAATAPNDELVNGAYYVPVAKKNAGSSYVRDEKLAGQLWEWTETELAKHGY